MSHKAASNLNNRRHHFVLATNGSSVKVCWVCGKVKGELATPRRCTPPDKGLFTTLYRHGEIVFNIWAWIDRRHGTREANRERYRVRRALRRA